jgi:hypothetical protein
LPLATVVARRVRYPIMRLISEMIAPKTPNAIVIEASDDTIISLANINIDSSFLDWKEAG